MVDLKSGEPFSVSSINWIKWKPYKHGVSRRLAKVGGRFQKLNEYGGWDNCDFIPEDYEPPINAELLEALECLLYNYIETGPANADEHICAINAKAAIAKAKGETQ